jgi:hypothetical protein
MILEKEANQLFQSLLMERGHELGFTLELNGNSNDSPPYLLRNVPEGKEMINGLFLDMFNSELLINLSFSKRISQIETFWLKYRTMLQPAGDSFDPESLITISSNLNKLKNFSLTERRKSILMQDKYVLKPSEIEISKFVNDLFQNIEALIQPLFDSFKTIEEIDLSINHEPSALHSNFDKFAPSGLMYKKMISAKLAKNENFQAVCDSMLELISESLSVNKVVNLEVFHLLRTELEG